MNIWDRLIREPLRKVSMRVLIWTEQKPKATGSSRQTSLLALDITVPPLLVAAGAAMLMEIILLFYFGWTWGAVFTSSVLIALIALFFIALINYDLPHLAEDDEGVMLLATLLILFSSITIAMNPWRTAFYLTPIAAAMILASLLLNLRIAVALAIVLSLLHGIVHEFSFYCFALSLTLSLTGALTSTRIRSHRDFIRVGILMAVAGMLMQILFSFWLGSSWSNLFWTMLWTLGNGLLSAVLALGLLPFFESFFQRMTPMKLQELADFNQPLLKRLMVEAPGTYHHSLMMAAIAESAAHAIGGNALLCRVGAYYHDIGKLVKPEYFIENQGGKANPHGEIAPTLSSLIVIQHVKEGVALARAAKLPQEIINFIPMHHGTSRIEYFYMQAIEDAQDELRFNPGGAPETEVEEEHYRYPGPKPMTKETAILMLADSVEAAARTLDEPTHPRLSDLVERLVQKKIADHQLTNSPLTLADLQKIKDAFIKTLTSIYHSRIEYPEDMSDDQKLY